MNRIHHWICSSSRWKRILENEVVPRICLELDPVFAGPLRKRMQNTNVTVVQGDATNMPFPDGEFTAAVSLTILHHVPTPMLQDRLLGEVHRVLRPGGEFVGIDATDTWSLRLMHWGDTLVPIDPAHLEPRLRRAGFADVEIETEKRAFRFSARRSD